MRALLAAIAMLPACKIADIHFIGLNGDDDARMSDGILGDGKLPIDGTASGHHAYLFVSDIATGTGQVLLLNRDNNGALTMTSTAYPAEGVIQAVQNRTGTALFALCETPPSVRAYTILADGTLQVGASMTLPPSCNTPTHITRSPDGNTLAIGCLSPTIITIQITSAGGLGALMPHGVNQANNIQAVAFSPDSQCLYAVDETTSAGLHAFTNNNGNIQELSTSPIAGMGMATAVAVDATMSWVLTAGGNGILASPINGGCNVLPNTGAGFGGDIDFMTPNPINGFLYGISTALEIYSVNGGLAPVQGDPFLQQTFAITGVTYDPQRHALYLTAPGFSGVRSVALNAQGQVTSSTQYMFPAAGNARWLELGP